ncbi:MAG TPA: potassium-transporting ATPase subunit KdpA, partial [Dissulfurispiraceae bacterium]|nr:potassium-transporting ATPase subunit KdpA [Dissulfurispiraceae bacterium]
MTLNGIFQIILHITVVVLLVKPLGAYMARVYEGEARLAQRIIGPLEKVIYRICGIRREEEMTWQSYAGAVLWFSLAGVVVLYLLQRFQPSLPLNPQALPAPSPDSSFNTAVSFVTNTNWQGYGGETTMSNLTQMAGLGVQNFLSAASGMAVLIALIRGFTRRSALTIGNFWVDLTRSTLYILLPLSIILAVALISQGVVQSFSPPVRVTLLQSLSYEQAAAGEGGALPSDGTGKGRTEHVPVKEQILPLGPVASQVAIKQLGTNGGGFFGVNSAHPFENPTPFSNFAECLSI